jgi:hypothetical protein
MSGKHGRPAADDAHGRRAADDAHGRRAADDTSKLRLRLREGASSRAASSDAPSGHESPSHAAAGHAASREAPAGRTATIDRPRQPADDAIAGSADALAHVDLIVPNGGRGSRRAARIEKQQKQRKQALAIGAGVVVVGLIAWAVTGGSGGAKKHGTGIASGARTQTTLLMQVQDSSGVAVDSALLGHDSASNSGVVVLVPSGVIAQVPGFGSMPFGQTLALHQPAVPRDTLSDLVGVTVDGSWVLQTKGLQALVDKVGGVTVTVDTDVTRPGANGTTTIVVPAGHHKLNGASAVAFATFLGANETEQLRLARFDAVFSAVLAKLPKQPAQLTQLLTGLGTSQTSSLATSRLAEVLVGLAADSAADSTSDTVLPVTKLDTGGDVQAFSLDAAGTSQLVKTQFADSVPKNKLVTGNRVMIENQVGTPGIGETTRAKLLAAGFTYLPGQNAPGMPNATAPSVVLITGTTAADIAQGNAVATALGLPTSDVRVSAEQIRVADIVVLLGADYKS